ncbi:hypothetical protein DKM44_14000 [Deinococcus irradiatisoli]|uniref:Toprim domain-containing protein n=1 Tax=Deinococcus irradiatisoli TaxID=2202254 RepID=A0A2Z3JUI5_9DEIO|nr:hypothetical protein [Deinococcus irradiatisoli]AWN24204.1 hypothetical protein DKM44_14000 [Deinococcus irradiatisoli]
MKLAELLDVVNLPDLIAQEWGPDAARGLTRERGGVICDRRPGQEETHPSFSVYKPHIWRWKRHGGDGASGNAYGFLLECGYTPQQAREELARHVGVALDTWQPSSYRPALSAPDPVREALGVLERCQPFDARELSKALRLLAPVSIDDAAGRDLQRRGLYGWPGLQAARLRRDFLSRDGRIIAHAGALGVLIHGPDEQVYGLKIRNLGSADELQKAGFARYIYRIGRHGAPAWCSPSYGRSDGLLIVEGELNGAAAALAAEVAGLSLDVQGLAGAGGTPFLEGMQGRRVHLYADPDPAGMACLERLSKLAQATGALEVRVLPALPDGDFSDLCGKLGPTDFANVLLDLFQRADCWQTWISGKTALPVNNAVPDGEKRLLANWQQGSGWGTADASGWGSDDRGGW